MGDVESMFSKYFALFFNEHSKIEKKEYIIKEKKRFLRDNDI